MSWMNALSLGRQHAQEDRAIADQQRLGKLSAAALTASPEGRNKVLGQVAALDPNAAFGMRETFQREDANAEERTRGQLVFMAKTLAAAPEPMRGGLYSQMVEPLRRMGVQAPDVWQPELMGVVQSLAGADQGGAQSAQRAYVEWMAQQLPEDRRGEYMLTQAGLLPKMENPSYSVQRIDRADGTVGFQQVPTRGGRVLGAQPAPPSSLQINPGDAPMPSPQAMEAIMAGVRSGRPFSVAVAPDGAIAPSQTGMDAAANRTLDAQTYGSPVGQATNATRAAAAANEAGLKTEAEALARQGAERLGEIRAAARLAGSEMSSLDALESQLAKVNTGAFAQTRINLGKAASFLGLSDGSEVSAAEAAQSIANRLALQLRNPAGGEGMPGAMSDADREFLASTIPSIANSEGGWRQMIEIRRRLARSAQEQAQEAERFMRQGGRATDLPGHMAEWASQRRLFDDMNGGQSVPEGLPPGARQAPDGNFYVQQGGRWFRVEQ